MSVSSLTARLAVRPVAVALSVLALAGGHFAWEATAKTVAITVDGQVQHVRTHGRTVRDALADAHLSVGPHDLLAPATDITLAPGTSIVLRHGRLMTLTVDGRQRQVWVTAMSVQEALAQVGLRADGAILSADRGRAIPLKGFSLDVRTRKQVQLLEGGKARRVATNGVLVSDLLAEQHVTLRSMDEMSPGPHTFLSTGEVVRVTRVDRGKIVDTIPIPYSVDRRPDGSMWSGDTRIITWGRDGAIQRTFTVRLVNGKVQVKQLVSSVQTAAPITEVLAYGTKLRPYSVPGADGLNWPALASCESGGNPQSVSSDGTYRGLYQFTLGTWHSLGGDGDPIDHPADEQTYRAKLLYMRSGRSPWPVCGQYL